MNKNTTTAPPVSSRTDYTVVGPEHNAINDLVSSAY